MSEKSSSSAINDTASESKRPNKKISILFELIQFIRPYKSQVLAAFLVLIFTAVVMLSVGQGVRMLIDEGFAQQSLTQLQEAVLYLLAITVLIAGGTFTRFYLVSWLGERVSADIRLAVFNHVITLHPSYYVAHHNRYHTTTKHYWLFFFHGHSQHINVYRCFGDVICHQY